MADISRIKIGGNTYDIKDSVARQAIAGGISFMLSIDAGTTPLGVTWLKEGVLITGTLKAKDVATREGTSIYLVPGDITTTHNVKREFVALHIGSGTAESDYAWEQIGDTEIDLKDVVKNVTLNKELATVLGTSTQFSASKPGITITPTTGQNFIKSYPGVKKHLDTVTITGVAGETTVNSVASNTSKTATNTVFGTNTSASKITTSSKTASYVELGTATKASKATAGTAISITGTNGTGTTYGLSESKNNVVYWTGTVSDETLELGTVNTAQATYAKVASSATSIPQYSFSDVSVPVVSTESVTFDSVATLSSVTVPVVSSNTEVTASLITETPVSVATKASNDTTVAIGTLSTSGTGDELMTDLGTAVTGQPLMGVSAELANAPTISVTPDTKNVLTSSTSITVEKAGD